jgi:hypothetical protein
MFQLFSSFYIVHNFKIIDSRDEIKLCHNLYKKEKEAL